MEGTPGRGEGQWQFLFLWSEHLTSHPMQNQVSKPFIKVLVKDDARAGVCGHDMEPSAAKNRNQLIYTQNVWTEGAVRKFLWVKAVQEIG